MNRDMYLIRLLLLKFETEEEPKELSNYTVKLQVYNLQLMADAQLIVADFISDGDGNAAIASGQRLTWAGHDFWDATRNSAIWKQAKEHVLKPGFSWTFQTLTRPRRSL